MRVVLGMPSTEGYYDATDIDGKFALGNKRKVSDFLRIFNVPLRLLDDDGGNDAANDGLDEGRPEAIFRNPCQDAESGAMHMTLSKFRNPDGSIDYDTFLREFDLQK